jgi:hypothetical protein
MSDQFGGLIRRPKLSDRTGAKVSTSRPQEMTAQKQLTPAEWKARRSRRSEQMMDALRQIDVAPNVQAQREIIDWLKDVYAQRGGGILVGLFGHCYLGPPYVDHAFDLTGAIREHYTASDTVPTMYQSARSLAVSDAYAFIEIYADGHVVPIRPDGTPAF